MEEGVTWAGGREGGREGGKGGRGDWLALPKLLGSRHVGEGGGLVRKRGGRERQGGLIATTRGDSAGVIHRREAGTYRGRRR